jgi:ferritin-like metal-binding protein YciE
VRWCFLRLDEIVPTPLITACEDVMAQLSDLFEDSLKDIYYAEKKIVKALPKMMKKTQSDELLAAFEKHLGETEQQIEHLETVFEVIGKKPQGKTCPAIDGIIKEGEELMEEHEPGETLDAGLVAAAQAVEHYEISRYRAMCNWATLLGYTEAQEPLTLILEQEVKTDEALEELGVSTIFPEALDMADDEDAAMRASNDDEDKPKRSRGRKSTGSAASR